MATWALDLIGIPVQYRNRSPFDLNTDERVDSFPAKGNPDCVNNWTTVLASDTPGVIRLDWQDAIRAYVNACASVGQQAFVHAVYARNTNEHVRNFLQERRRRIVKYIDSTNLLTRTIWHANHSFVRLPNSMVVRAHVHFRPIKDGLAIGSTLQQTAKFTRTTVPFAQGVVWHRWIEFGIARILWSAQGHSDAKLYYEIHCPFTPELPLTESRNIADKQFNAYVDDHIWRPLIKTQRYWSSSNPKIWNF